MATRSVISIENLDGTVTSTHCHWDGYLAGVGKTLLKHYDDRDCVERLIEPDGQHNIKNPADGVTIAYHRDRGDAWEAMKPRQFESLAAFVDSDFGRQDAAYFYVFTKDDIWGVYTNKNGKPIQEMQILDDICPV
jgi:hypothetical protein